VLTPFTTQSRLQSPIGGHTLHCGGNRGLSVANVTSLFLEDYVSEVQTPT